MSSHDIEILSTYSPVILFDRKEPFLPVKVGYTIFEESGKSPSTPLFVALTDEEKYAIEYAIYWDYDIQHLYELEHVWIYVGKDDNVSRVKASWHGIYNEFPNDILKFDGKHVYLYSQPGKHAFSPVVDTFFHFPGVIESCSVLAGTEGLLLTSVFQGVYQKSALKDYLARKYLEKFAFIPSLEFDKEYRFSEDMFVRWEELYEWIPKRIKECLYNIFNELIKL